MIVQKLIEIDGQTLVRTYSDANRAVIRDGISYTEAIDPAGLGRTYTEGDPLPELPNGEVKLRMDALEHRQDVADDALEELIIMMLGDE